MLKTIKGMIFFTISLIACLYLLKDFTDNLQAAEGEIESPYTWAAIQDSLGLNLGGKKITELTLADFKPEQQVEIEQYSDVVSIETLTAQFCATYGSEEYYAMEASVTEANAGRDFQPLFYLWHTIAKFCKQKQVSKKERNFFHFRSFLISFDLILKLALASSFRTEIIHLQPDTWLSARVSS